MGIFSHTDTITYTCIFLPYIVLPFSSFLSLPSPMCVSLYFSLFFPLLSSSFSFLFILEKEMTQKCPSCERNFILLFMARHAHIQSFFCPFFALFHPTCTRVTSRYSFFKNRFRFFLSWNDLRLFKNSIPCIQQLFQGRFLVTGTRYGN